jgi:hypothetical protein
VRNGDLVSSGVVCFRKFVVNRVGPVLGYGDRSVSGVIYDTRCFSTGGVS